ncbi:hypothetical protein ACOSQ3_027568 [Xanthoceras sorbifolium]
MKLFTASFFFYKNSEFDEERLMRNSVGKDKDLVFKKLGVSLDSGSTIEADLPIPLTDIAGSSRINQAPLLINVSLEEVLGKVVTGKISSADQKNTDGFVRNTIERQLQSFFGLSVSISFVFPFFMVYYCIYYDS